MRNSFFALCGMMSIGVAVLCGAWPVRVYAQAAASAPTAQPAPAQPAGSAPGAVPPAAAAVPSTAPAGEAPTLEQIIEQLARLDDKPLMERIASARARVQVVQAESTPLRQRVAAADGELPRLTIKLQMVDALAKARGAGPAPGSASGATDGPVDALVEQALAVEPKALVDQLAKMQARAKTLQDDQTALRPRIAAMDAELAKLTGDLAILESLLKAKSMLPKPPAPAPPPPMPAPSPPASAPTKPMAAAAMNSPTAGPMAMATDKAQPPMAINYAEHVLPIFSARCIGCHNADKARGGLALDTHAAAMAGGSSGAVIVPGAADRSRLLRLVSHIEEPHMPPQAAKLEDDKIATIRNWIAGGAPADATAAVTALASGAKAAPKATAKAAALVQSAVDDGAPPMPGRLQKGPVRAGIQPMPIVAMAASGMADLLAVAGIGQILFYSTSNGDLLGLVDSPLARMSQLTFSRDGTLLAVAGGVPGESGGAVVYEVETLTPVAALDWLFDTALAVAISPDNSLVAVGGTNRRVRVFDLRSAARMFEVVRHNEWVTALAFSPDGLWLASADRAGVLYVCEADTGRDMFALRGHSGAVSALDFRNDGVLISAGMDGTVRQWEMEEGRQLAQWPAHDRACFDVATHADGRIASCGADGLAKLWKSDGGAIATCERQSDWLYRVAFARDGQKLLTGGWTGDVCAFETQSGKRVSCTQQKTAVDAAH